MNSPQAPLPYLRCERLCKSFGEREVLREIDLDLLPGTITVLTGPNGSGKTTLGRILCGLDAPTSGKVIVSSPQLRRMFLPQDFVIWPHLSVRSNLMLAARRTNPSRRSWIEKILADFSLSELAENKARVLSWGQQHRLALARAVVFEPDILVLDEPMAHADQSSRVSLGRILADRIRGDGIAALWITHEKQEVPDAESMISLQEKW